jgi:hypothetical protein
MPSSSAPSSGQAPSPGRAFFARALVLFEGLALLLTGLVLAALTVLERPTRLEAALFEVAAALGTGAVLVVASRKIIRSIHWRSPVLLLNLLALPVSISLAQSGQWLISLPLAFLAVAVLVLLAGGKSLA